MDAAKFIQERNRMCNSFDTCSTCPIDANVDIDCPDCRREFWTQEVE